MFGTGTWDLVGSDGVRLHIARSLTGHNPR